MATSAPEKSVSDCVALLSAAKDEQRFVGLLLATKLMQTPEDLQRIFDAGLPLCRLLLDAKAGAGAS